LAARVEARFGVRFAVISVFQYPTIRQLARLVDSLRAGAKRPGEGERTGDVANAEFDQGVIGEDFPAAVGQSR